MASLHPVMLWAALGSALLATAIAVDAADGVLPWAHTVVGALPPWTVGEELAPLVLGDGGEREESPVTPPAPLAAEGREFDDWTCQDAKSKEVFGAISAGNAAQLQKILDAEGSLANAVCEALGPQASEQVSPLVFAVSRDFAEGVSVLLAAEARPRLGRWQSLDTFGWALKHHNSQVVLALLEAFRHSPTSKRMFDGAQWSGCQPDKAKMVITSALNGDIVGLANAIEQVDPREDGVALNGMCSLDNMGERIADVSPLVVCAATGDEACVRLLLEKKADPMVGSYHGRDALRSAVVSGSAASARLLLAAILPRGQDTKWAMRLQGDPTAKMLLEKVLQVGTGTTTLDQLGILLNKDATAGTLSTVSTLSVAPGQDWELTPLAAAVLLENVELAQLLLDRGAKRELGRFGGLDPYGWAVALGNAELQSALEVSVTTSTSTAPKVDNIVDIGFDQFDLLNCNPKSAEDLVRAATRDRWGDDLSSLIDIARQSGDISGTCKFKTSTAPPEHEAAVSAIVALTARNMTHAVQRLLDVGADPRVGTFQGLPALGWAGHNKNVLIQEMIKEKLRQGCIDDAEVWLKDNSGKPLECISEGAFDVNKELLGGRTLIEKAVCMGSDKSVKVLLTDEALAVRDPGCRADLEDAAPANSMVICALQQFSQPDGGGGQAKRMLTLLTDQLTIQWGQTCGGKSLLQQAVERKLISADLFDFLQKASKGREIMVQLLSDSGAAICRALTMEGSEDQAKVLLSWGAVNTDACGDRRDRFMKGVVDTTCWSAWSNLEEPFKANQLVYLIAFANGKAARERWAVLKETAAEPGQLWQLATAAKDVYAACRCEDGPLYRDLHDEIGNRPGSTSTVTVTTTATATATEVFCPLPLVKNAHSASPCKDFAVAAGLPIGATCVPHCKDHFEPRLIGNDTVLCGSDGVLSGGFDCIESTVVLGMAAVAAGVVAGTATATAAAAAAAGGAAVGAAAGGAGGAAGAAAGSAGVTVAGAGGGAGAFTAAGEFTTMAGQVPGGGAALAAVHPGAGGVAGAVGAAGGGFEPNALAAALKAEGKALREDGIGVDKTGYNFFSAGLDGDASGTKSRLCRCLPSVSWMKSTAKKYAGLVVLAGGSCFAIFTATKTGGNIVPSACFLFFTVVGIAVVMFATPGSALAQCLQAVAKRGDACHPRFWARCEFFLSLCIAAAVLAENWGEVSGIWIASVLAVGAYAYYKRWRCPCCKRVPAAIMIYALGGLVALGLAAHALHTKIVAGELQALAVWQTLSKAIEGLLDDWDFNGDADIDMEIGKAGDDDVELGEMDVGMEPTASQPSPWQMAGDLAQVAQLLPMNWMAGAFEALMEAKEVSETMASMYIKYQEQPCADGSVSQAKDFALYIANQWRDKHGSLIDELCAVMRMPASEKPPHDPEEMDIELLRCLVGLCKEKYAQHFCQRVQNQPVAMFAVWLYTMQDADIDRVCLFSDVPRPPQEGSMDDLHAYYKGYRQGLEVPRNPQMFEASNWATRAAWDSFVTDGWKIRDDARIALLQHLKWQCGISCFKPAIEPSITVYRAYTGVAPALLEQLSHKKKGEILFFANLTSCTKGRELAESIASSGSPEQNVFVTVQGVREGWLLKSISDYPNEDEVVLPMCSILKVREVTPGTPVKIVCFYESCALPKGLEKEVLEDLRECRKVMDTFMIVGGAL